MAESNIIAFSFNGYYTLIVATLALLLGQFISRKFSFFRNFNIPEAVIGGLIFSCILMIFYYSYHIEINFDSSLKDACMLMFFSSIGLSADFKKLKAGGKPLLHFTILIIIFVCLQDTIGVALTFLFDGLKPAHGLILGSITLVGGHGTAIAWGPIFETHYGIVGASALGIIAATYGLVMGGLIGGPLAKKLIEKVKLPTTADVITHHNNPVITTFESPDKTRLITAKAAIEVMAMFAICLSSAYFLSSLINDYFFEGSKVKIPDFVFALGIGIVIRNIISHVFNYTIFDRCIDLFGNVALAFFLAIALVSLKLWQLSGIGSIVFFILLIQTLVILLYAYFITFRFMGKNYDSIVIAAGHCGFGLGATPTAVANMQAVTDHYGPSYKAFLIVPLVGAFFVDIINVGIISLFQWFFTFL